MGIIDLKAENARLRLLDRQTCGSCGEPLCKDITPCRVCVDKIVAENTKLRELLAVTIANVKGNCEHCKKQKDCLSRKGSHQYCWQWQHADKLKELGILQDET